ncbi:Mpo1 family 2-hydroxy fatty acid dioxygenase [Marinobacter mobilis]|uniref:Uncharacterized membrane protein YGL010W n=1 Tax=Marinobacter mobilis TaxID=488533 RepID=A0A1H3D140_9GAMM|nr:Mpo1-like protein [Marinobacter mobilis]SDX60183.1 Uncharacterized membrane protein YGL010W [Marinobacter mobilis]
MRSLQQFLSDYGDSHQNPLNQWIHIICVPAILISTLGLLWLVPVGSWLALPESVAYWVNGATILGVLSGVLYLRLGWWVFLLMAGWFALSLWLILSVVNSGWSLLWLSVAVWVAAWIVQVYGHKVEGKKPSFVDDLVFLLIGPIFVSIEFVAKLGVPVPLALNSHKGHTSAQGH